MNRYGVYFIVLLIIVPLLFFVPTVLTQYPTSNEVDDVRNVSYGCSEPENMTESIIHLNSYNYSENQVEMNITYEFVFESQVEEYQVVESVLNDVESVRRNPADNRIFVNVEKTENVGYESSFKDEDVIVYEPDLDINRVLDNEGHSINPNLPEGVRSKVPATETYSYGEYYSCFSEINYEDSVTGYISDDEILMEFGSGDGSATMYNIDVNNSGRNFIVFGELSDDRLSHVISSAEISGSYNQTFTKSSRVQVYSVKNMSAPGFIVGLHTESPLIFMEPNHITSRSAVVGHEFSHSFQNFRTARDADWMVEGSAQYMGSLINNEADTMYTDPGRHAFWPGWNERAEQQNETLYNDIRMVEPESWSFEANYKRGGRISYLIDRAIRYHTDNKTIFDFTKRLNEEGYVSHQDTVRILEEMTSERFSDRYDRLVKQSEPVDIESELDSMKLENNDIHFPETFNRNDSHVTKCNYDSNVVIVDKCKSEN